MVRRKTTTRPKRPKLTPEQRTYRNKMRMRSAFRKGNRFEDTVVGMFDPRRFELVHRTPTNDDTDGRFVEEMKFPDLKFMEISTGRKFWVEVKYRAGTHRDGSTIWCSERQLEHYRETQTESGDPVFVMVGLGGTVDAPNHTYLVRLDDLYDTTLRRAEYAPHEVHLKQFMSYGQIEKVAGSPRPERKEPSQ